MKAVSCCSGGVMFVPDEIERETNSQPSSKSYKDLVGDDALAPALKSKILGAEGAAVKASDASACAGV